MADEPKCPECKKGAPDWMVTFSDLMTLLLTFFVLLLSMATVDKPKFDRTATSLQEAFSGLRIIGKPESVPIEIPEMAPANKKVKVERTDESVMNTTDVKDKDKEYDSPTQIKENLKQEMQQQLEQQKEEMRSQALKIIEKQLQDSLTKEIDTGIAEIEKQQDQILLRFPAEATFRSGSADLNPKMKPTFEKLGRTLRDRNMTYIVTGHTDDDPISTQRYRSNWDLSAARASTIAMELQNYGEIRSKNMEVVGFADGIPIAPNDSPSNKRRNRRIEVFIQPNEEDFDAKIFEEIVGTVESVTFSSTGDLPDTVKTQKPTPDKVTTDSISAEEPSRLDEILEKIRSFRRRR